MHDPKPRPQREAYLKVLRAMTPEQKLKKVFELNEFGKTLLKAGLRQRHPNLSDDELHRLFVERWTKCHNRNY